MLPINTEVNDNDFRKKMFSAISENTENFSNYFPLFEIVKNLEFKEEHLYQFKVGENEVIVIAVK